MAWHFSRAGEWSRPQWQCWHCKRERLHKKRNCRFFPDEWQDWRPTAWVREIGGAKVPGTKVTECPVSMITPETLAVIDMVHGSQVAHEMAGAALFGSDSGKWPARYFDAVRLIQREKNREFELMNAGNTNGRK